MLTGGRADVVVDRRRLDHPPAPTASRCSPADVKWGTRHCHAGGAVRTSRPVSGLLGECDGPRATSPPESVEWALRVPR